MENLEIKETQGRIRKPFLKFDEKGKIILPPTPKKKSKKKQTLFMRS